MDKFVTKSAENSIFVGKPKPPDPSINTPEETEVSGQASSVEPENIEEKLDISSEFVAEHLPDSASKISIPSTSLSHDGHQLSLSFQKLCS